MRSTALFIAIVFVFLLATSPTVFAGFGQKEHYFPQYAIGGPAETHLTVHNPGQTPITVEIELRRSDGSVFLTDTVQLDPGATETRVYRDPSAPPVDGWAKLTSQDEFTATLFYRIPGTGNVGVLSSSKTEQLKLLTFVGQDTDTALAIANPSATNDCNMTFSFYDQAGRLQRQETTSLGALGHDAFFVTEAPYAVGANGSILIEATEPVVALALRLDRQLLASTALLTPMGAALLPGAVTTEYLADGAVTGNKISDRTITGEKIANNQVVRSLNGLQDSVELVAGPNVMITPSGQQLTISSTNPGGDITAVDAGTGLEGGGLQGAVGLGIADGGVGPNQLAPEVSLGRVQAGPSGATANIILGFSSNHVVSGVGGAAIGGGGSEAGSSPNQVTDHYGTVAGGESN